MSWSPYRQEVDRFLDDTFMTWGHTIPDRARCLDVGGGVSRGTWNPNRAAGLTAGAHGRLVGQRWDVLDTVARPDVDYVASVTEIPLPDRTYDVVKATDMLYLVDDPHSALRECARVLKGGGLFIATVPYMYPWTGETYDRARWVPMEWERQLKEAGFTSSHISGLGGPVVLIWQIAYDRWHASTVMRGLTTRTVSVARSIDTLVGTSTWSVGHGIVAVK